MDHFSVCHISCLTAIQIARIIHLPLKLPLYCLYTLATWAQPNIQNAMFSFKYFHQNVSKNKNHYEIARVHPTTETRQNERKRNGQTSKTSRAGPDHNALRMVCAATGTRGGCSFSQLHPHFARTSSFSVHSPSLAVHFRPSTFAPPLLAGASLFSHPPVCNHDYLRQDALLFQPALPGQHAVAPLDAFHTHRPSSWSNSFKRLYFRCRHPAPPQTASSCRYSSQDLHLRRQPRLMDGCPPRKSCHASRHGPCSPPPPALEALAEGSFQRSPLRSACPCNYKR